MHPRTRCFLVAVLLPSIASFAVAQQPGKADARADARAEAHATAQNGETRTATHRVVVIDGKTVVDERTENGKPVGGGAGRGAVPMPPLPSGGMGAEEMLRKLQEDVRRQLEGQGGAMPPLPLPPAGNKPVPRRV